MIPLTSTSLSLCRVMQAGSNGRLRVIDYLSSSKAGESPLHCVTQTALACLIGFTVAFLIAISSTGGEGYQGGRIDGDAISTHVPSTDAKVCICGPPGMMQALHQVNCLLRMICHCDLPVKCHCILPEKTECHWFD